MKLSKAIRQGAKLRPQAFGGLRLLQIVPVCQNGILGLSVIQKTSCAMGAAIEAAGCEEYQETVGADSTYLRMDGVTVGQKITTMDLPAEWTTVLYTQSNCPQCDDGNSVVKIIAHLNDDHKWKREEIALWVERVERTAEWLEESKQEAEQLEVEVAEVRL